MGNNIFSFKRFALLFRKDIMENSKLYLLGSLVMFGILVIMSTIMGFDNSNSIRLELDFDFFYIFSIGFSVIFTSIVFGRMSNKAKRIAEISLPASSIEKFLVKWILVAILYNILYIIVFYSSMYVSSFIVNMIYPSFVNIELRECNNIITYIVACALIQSFYMCGALLMPKLSFIKTSVLLFVCMLIYYSYINLLDSVVDSLGYRMVGPIFDVRIYLGLITVLLWCFSYYRYKEECVNYRLL